MPINPENTQVIETTVPRQLADQLRDSASANDRSVAAEARRAIKQYLATTSEAARTSGGSADITRMTVRDDVC